MLQRHFLVFVCMMLCQVQSFAAAYVYDFDARCQKAYQYIMALQASEADKILKEEISKNPNNLIPYYLADYNDCLGLLFNGDKADYTAIRTKVQERISLLENGPKDSPWYRFCLANMQLHWAIVQIRFGDNLKAAGRFRKSFLLLKENKNRFPHFAENKVLWGLELAVAGAIPEQYRWIASIMGIRGDIHRGVSEIAHYLNSKEPKLMQEEAMIYYAYLRFYLQNQPESAWRYINGPHYREEGNLMRSFIKANLALNYRKAEQAEKILQAALLLPDARAYPILQYEIAEAKMAHLDFRCTSAYRYFVEHHKGQHFIKDAYLKLAQCHFLLGEKEIAEQQLAKLLGRGISITDADKQAQNFAEKPKWPKPQLLQVKLLIDGGFYLKALQLIQNIDPKHLEDNAHVLEYNFRYGRIFEELSNPEKAHLFYDATIEIGRYRKEYFAARACLQKGLMHERSGNKKEAARMFQECLSMRHHDAQNSIDQLAKAGLNRLGLDN